MFFQAMFADLASTGALIIAHALPPFIIFKKDNYCFIFIITFYLNISIFSNNLINLNKVIVTTKQLS